MIGYGQSGITHDFFAYNSSGQVWNGAAYESWSDGSYATYRITATEAGTSGRFVGTEPTGAVAFELRERGATLATSYVVWSESDLKLKEDATTAATEVAKIPRKATSITAGAASTETRTTVTDTTSQLVETRVIT